MIHKINFLAELTGLSLESTKNNLSVDIDSYEGNFNNFVSEAFNKLSKADLEYKENINILNSPLMTSNPKFLFQLQKYLGEYSNYVSLVSTLARKGVSTIETLEKS
ncbi:type III secretion system inner rod subunit SctI [Salmonella enterica]|nr:type III secretion system inner rod subunit SctI [Salmonella enterica]